MMFESNIIILYSIYIIYFMSSLIIYLKFKKQIKKYCLFCANKPQEFAFKFFFLLDHCVYSLCFKYTNC